ncbi:MAG: CHAT domain-containing protein [Cyanobacteria bacterium J06631_12]
MKKRLLQWTARVAKLCIKPVAWVAGVATTLSPAVQKPAAAEVVPTVNGAGTTVTDGGDQYDIAGGTQAGGNLFHEFEEFSLTEAETANFTSDSGVFNIVGRVSAANPSYIDGTIQVEGSDADLYLLNPSGVLFGPNAQLALPGSFTATTADQVEFGEQLLSAAETNPDYTALREEPSAFRFSEPSAGAVVNQGELAVAPGESISLIGSSVVNTGELEAPGGEIGLVAVGGESTVRLKTPGSLLSLEVVGTGLSGTGNDFAASALPALLTGNERESVDTLELLPNGDVVLRGSRLEAGEVAVSGLVSAASDTGAGGAIALAGDSVEIAGGAVDASGLSGGTVRIGGGLAGEAMPAAEATHLREDGSVRADGLTGAGGDIYVGAGHRATVQGEISARGATAGGFVETSADYIDVNGAVVDATGADANGHWLIDPVDIEIVNGPGGPNQIDAALIESQLDSGVDFTVQTTSGTGGNGDIALLTGIQQTGGGSAALTFTARRFEDNGHDISLSSTGDLTFNLNVVNPEAVTGSDSIDSAIGAIANVNGRRLINLGAGNYTFDAETTILSSVDIEGAGTANTTLSATDSHRHFDIESSVEVALRNLTVTTDGLAPAQLGGGIENSGDLTIANVHFVDNRAPSGGAINSYQRNGLPGGNLTISNSEFRDSSALTSGGAIALTNSSSSTIDSTLFENNAAIDDGGALRVANSTLSVGAGTRFVNNTSEDDGAAVGVRGTGRTDFNGVTFERNVSNSSGGAFAGWSGATVAFDDVVFSENSARESGGALSLDHGTYDIDNSIIERNLAVDGGAIKVLSSALTTRGTLLDQNTAGDDGGAVHATDNSTVNLNAGTVFSGNTAADDGGGFFTRNTTVNAIAAEFLSNTAQEGGGLYASTDSDVTVQDTTFERNIANTNGGGIRLSAGTATLSASTFTDNQAALGGGLEIRASAVTAVDSVFENNSAADSGGGIHAFGDVTLDLEAVTLSDNSAFNGGGVFVNGGTVISHTNTRFDGNTVTNYGGAIAARESELDIAGTVFEGNQAVTTGGAIRATADTTVTVSAASELLNNQSAIGGAIYVDDGSAISVSAAAFENNYASQFGGGLYANTLGVVAVRDSTFTENVSDDVGGAIALYQVPNATVTNTVFTQNDASSGGAVSIADNTRLTAQNSNFLGNTAADNGGGLSAVNRSEVTVSGMTFAANTARNGGGLYASNSAVQVSAGNQLSGNLASRDGGAIALVDSSANLTDVLLSGNQAGRSGGGVYKNSAAALEIAQAEVSDNTAGVQGGGLSLSGTGNTTLNAVTVNRNRADGSGGAIEIDEGALDIQSATLGGNQAVVDGGAIYQAGTAEVSVSQVSLSGNLAGNVGGAIANQSVQGALSISDSTIAQNAADETGGAIFSDSAGVVTIAGATVLENEASNGDGGAISLHDDASAVIASARFERNRAGDQGGAIHSMASGELQVAGSTFSQNTAVSDGGAIANNITQDALTVRGSTFEDNASQEDGGAIFVRADGQATLERNEFSRNQAVGRGGALYTAGNATVADSEFEANQAEDGGAIAGDKAGELTLTDTQVVGNQSISDGGGLYLTAEATATVSGQLVTDAAGQVVSASTRFENNVAVNKDGGAIGLEETNHLDLSGVLIRGNQAGDDGGGIAITDFSVGIIENVHIENNRAGGDGGGIYANNYELGPSTNQVTVENSRIVGNSADNFGGGLSRGLNGNATVRNSHFENNQAAIDGGGIRASDGVTTLENVQLVNNQADFGGGLEVSDTAQVIVEESTFQGNRARIGGGALVEAGTTLTVTSSTFEANTADAGGGLFNAGTSELTNSTFSANTAVDGGAINSFGAAAALTVRNSTLSQNVASQRGGGIRESFTQGARLQNTIVAGNASPDASDVSGTFADKGNNLIGRADAATGFTASALVGTSAASIDPQLAPLADNGGPTKTHRLLADSAAINAGGLSNLPAVDQRGGPRFVGESVDIGAVELTEAELPPPEPSVVEPVGPVDGADEINDRLIDPAVSTADFSGLDSLLAIRREHKLNDANVSIRRLEHSFSQGFEDYWDLSAGPDLGFEEVQAVLRRAQEEYKVNSAVIYAIFAPDELGEEDASTILQVDPTPAADDLLNLSVVMPEGELVSYQLPVTRREASRQVRMLRSTVSDPDDAHSYQPLTHQLYQWLLAPIETDLAAQNIQNLMYALDAGLRTAPVTAMHDGDEFSLERYGISVVPSMGLMQADFPVPVRRATVAMGVSEFQSEQPLPAVPIELEAVKSIVPVAQTVLNEGTTVDALSAVQALEQPGILHLATHASFDNRSPESSYIQMWNEPLNMKAFSQLGWGESDLELLILSACSTALSGRNSELGFAGLAAASGVDATVGSLWQVSDVGTLALMSEFYSQLESTNLRFEALRKAQLSLLRGETRIEGGDLTTSRGEIDLPDDWSLPESAMLDHPFFWSAFTMIGNPW